MSIQRAMYVCAHCTKVKDVAFFKLVLCSTFYNVMKWGKVKCEVQCRYSNEWMCLQDECYVIQSVLHTKKCRVVPSMQNSPCKKSLAEFSFARSMSVQQGNNTDAGYADTGSLVENHQGQPSCLISELQLSNSEGKEKHTI